MSIYAKTYFLALSAYFAVIGFVAINAKEEVDLSIELNDLAHMEAPHFEAGPITVRVIAILINVFFVSED